MPERRGCSALEERGCSPGRAARRGTWSLPGHTALSRRDLLLWFLWFFFGGGCLFVCFFPSHIIFRSLSPFSLPKSSIIFEKCTAGYHLPTVVSLPLSVHNATSIQLLFIVVLQFFHQTFRNCCVPCRCSLQSKHSLCWGFVSVMAFSPVALAPFGIGTPLGINLKLERKTEISFFQWA